MLCLAQHPTNPDIVASGQQAWISNGKSQPPTIAVQNSVTGETIALIKNAGERAIRAVAFSPDGAYVAGAACDDKHTINVFDVKTGKKVASGAANTRVPLNALAWNPANVKELVSVGTNHLVIWSFDDKVAVLKGKSMTPIFTGPGTEAASLAFFSAAYNASGSQLVVGAQDGAVYVLGAGAVTKTARAHRVGGTKKVHAVVPYGKGWALGGDDKIVYVVDEKWNVQLQQSNQYQIRALAVSGKGDLAVGSRGSELLFIPASVVDKGASESKENTNPVLRGHFDGEVWGVAPNPKSNTFATVGEDNQVIVWDADKKTATDVTVINSVKGRFVKVNKAATTSNFPVNQMARAIDYSPDGKLLAIGTNEGTVSVYDTSNMKQVQTVDLNKYGKRQITTQSQNWIEALKFSPSGKTLAVGTHGICICLLNVAKNFAVEKALKEHTAAILSIDWSADSANLRSISLSTEILYHAIDEDNLAASKHVPSAIAVRDVVWATQTGKFDWSVMGIWQKSNGTVEVDESNINSVDVNPARDILAVANDEGNVHLFAYPAVNDFLHEKADNQFKVYAGHSAHVARVKFDATGKRLFSSGGEDKCIFQWKVV